jgi:hypothetical protein
VRKAFVVGIEKHISFQNSIVKRRTVKHSKKERKNFIEEKIRLKRREKY